MSANKQDLLHYIHEAVRCFDGAMGSMLFRKGISTRSCPETVDAEIIKSIHREYVEAGAQFITTNTFGGSRIKLNNYNLGDKAVEINKRNALLAREALPGGDYFVVGDIGPTGEFVEPFGTMTVEQFYDIFAEQVGGLLKGGVDAFIIETMSSIEEVQAAIRAAHDNSDLLVIGCMTFDKTPQGYRTLAGVDVKSAIDAMIQAGADVVGTNCTLSPADIVDLAKEFRSLTDFPIIAEPNAGQPKIVEGQTVYNIGDDVEKHLEEIIAAGVNLVGGCCGTTPEYITTLRRLVDKFNNEEK